MKGCLPEWEKNLEYYVDARCSQCKVVGGRKKEMKRWKKLLAGLLAMAVVLTCVPGYGLEVKAEKTLVEGDYQYEVNQDGNVAIVRYRGIGGNVVIPSEIAGRKVTDIKKEAFYGCTLTGVTIPSSVTGIGKEAFGYYYPENEDEKKKVDNFTISGASGSAAETYAKKNGFTFRLSPDSAPSQEGNAKTVYKVAYGAKPFKINAASKSKMVFTSSKPAVAAVDRNSGKVTVKNTGIAIITIKAGNTVKKVAVKVSPRKPSVKSAKTAKGRKLTVKWAKDKRASGYQVQISTDKKFKKNLKSKSLPQISCTFTKLKTGKKYYARIRSYKKSGKEKLYSAWSKAKLGGKVKK